MLFEAALLGCFVYIVGTGKSARAAARTVGFGVGRAAGSLRRVRAEVDSAQQRVQSVGGAELHANRAQVAERMRRMRAIQAETLALVSMYPRGAAGGMMPSGAAPPPFSDEELAAAMGSSAGLPPQPAAAAPWAGAGAPAAAAPAATAAAAATPAGAGAAATGTAAAASGSAAPGAAAAAGVAYYYEGKPVIQATFEDVWDAGSSVPRGMTQQHIADAIRHRKDLVGTVLPEAEEAPKAPPPQHR